MAVRVTTGHLDPVQVIADLNLSALELDSLSKDLAGVERSLEPLTAEYEQHLGDFEAGLWVQYVEGAEGKMSLPGSEATRERMARRQMPTEFVGRYSALMASRKRLERRIASLKASVDAKRSVLSALKAEIEATR